MDLSDTIRLRDMMFAIPPAPSTCDDANDINDDGTVDAGDLVYLLQALYIPGSPSIPVPNVLTGPGPDPTSDTLDCVTYTGLPSYPTWEAEMDLTTGRSFAHLADGSVVVAGNYGDNWPAETGIRLHRLASDGTLMWDRPLLPATAVDQVRVKSVVATRTGRIFVMGFLQGPSSGIAVFEVDDQGRLVDAQEFSVPGSTALLVVPGGSDSMIALYDDYGVFQGLGISATILEGFPGLSQFFNMYHTRLDADLVEEPGYPVLFGNPGAIATTSEGLRHLSDGSVVLYGWGDDTAALVRVDEDGSPIWENYDASLSSDKTEFLDLEVAANGDLVSFGGILPTGGPWIESVHVHDPATGSAVMDYSFQTGAKVRSSHRLLNGDYVFVSGPLDSPLAYGITTVSSSSFTVIDQADAPIAGSAVFPAMSPVYWPTQVSVLPDGDLGLLSFSTVVAGAQVAEPIAAQFVKINTDLTFD